MSTASPTDRRPEPKWLRPTVDYLGLALFFVGFFVSGKNLLAATWWLVAGSAIGLLLSLAVIRRVPPLPLVWGGAALLFGLLTLVFHDPVFVKLKTTFVDVGLAAALFIGLALGKSPLKMLMGDALKLSDAGWRRLTLRYGAFFLVLAAVNVGLAFYAPDEVWLLFRMPGLLILAVLFSLTQLPMMLKEMKAHEVREAEAAARLTELQE